MRWKQSFAAKNCLLSERKFFNATSRMLWKKIFSATRMRWKKFSARRMRWKKFSPLKLQILQTFTAKFNAYRKFTWKIIKVKERWRSGIRSCWHVGGDRFEPIYGSFFFCKKSGECDEFFVTAKNHNSYKNSPHSMLKDGGALRWRKFFPPLSTANLTLFFDQTSTRVETKLFSPIWGMPCFWLCVED